MIALVAGCGQSKAPIVFDSGPATFPGTTPALSETTTPVTAAATSPVVDTSPATVGAPVEGPWNNATDGLVGLSSECGNLSLLSVRPDQDTMIVSVAQQGLWESVDGAVWTRLGTGRGSAKITNRGTVIVYDPLHPATFWESGIYNGGGVYRTDDAGVTFRQLGDLTKTEAVSIDLTDPLRSTLIVTGHEAATFYRSTDGGATWTDLSGSLPPGIGYATGPVVIDGKTYLLGTNTGANSGIFRTADAGASWTKVYPVGAVGRPLIAKSDGAMYWPLDLGQGIIKSTDGGLTWKVVTQLGIVAPAAPQLFELPDGRLGAAGGNLVVLSSDHGSTWNSVGPAMPFTPTGLAFSAFRKAFYAWHVDCDFTTADPIQANQIVRLDFDPAKQ